MEMWLFPSNRAERGIKINTADGGRDRGNDVGGVKRVKDPAGEQKVASESCMSVNRLDMHSTNLISVNSKIQYWFDSCFIMT